MVLRIEDTDTDRHQATSEATIFEDLRWLGLDWDEGPDVGGDHGPYRQSERSELYREAGQRLLRAGRAYRCFCPSDGVTPYPGTCRGLDPEEATTRAGGGEPHAIRFAVVDPQSPADMVRFEDGLRGTIEFPTAELGDTVIVRQDGRPTYNFAVVVDDAAMAIDEVIRGDDHLSNTPRQVLLFDALGSPRPRFVHLPMVRGQDGSRLSKRHGAVSVGDYRERGYPAGGVVNALALLGWGPQDDEAILSVDELRERFSLSRVGRSPAAFDPEKFDWVCAQQIVRQDDGSLGDEIGQRLHRAGLLESATLDPDWQMLLVALVRPGLSRYTEIPERLQMLFDVGAGGETAVDGPLASAEGRSVAGALIEALEQASPVDGPGWKQVVATVKERSGQKGKALFQPIRLALTGRQHGPDLDRLVPAIVVGHRLNPQRVPSAVARIRGQLEQLGER